MSKKNPLLNGALFRTPVEIPAPLKSFDVADRVVFLGSCFAQHIGKYFLDSCLNTVVNPLGTLYNPFSVADVVLACDVGDVVQGPQGWHSWLTGTQLTCPTAEEAQEKAGNALCQLHDNVMSCSHLIITLGTNRYYELKSTGRSVVNCHKHPQREFRERILQPQQIVQCMSRLLDEIKIANPACTVTFTVSPYRYAKYGYHESQLSKAALLLAVDELQRSYADMVQYFPAYEIVMDELRDYRFYEADMLHVSPVAINYIWQQLHQWMTSALQNYLQRYAPLRAACNHSPVNPDSEEYRTFQERTHRHLQQLQADYPQLQITKH